MPETIPIGADHAGFLDEEPGVSILREWLGTSFPGGRHARRVAKIEETAPDV